MANKYTDKMLTELREIGSFDYNSATEFATKHGLSPRSVIAKVRAMELAYKTKEVKRSPQIAGPSKTDLINAIEYGVGSKLASLSKMTVADLAKLEKIVQ